MSPVVDVSTRPRRQVHERAQRPPLPASFASPERQAYLAAANSAELLETVNGEVIGAARARLWASSLGQVDPRSPART